MRYPPEKFWGYFYFFSFIIYFPHYQIYLVRITPEFIQGSVSKLQLLFLFLKRLSSYLKNNAEISVNVNNKIFLQIYIMIITLKIYSILKLPSNLLPLLLSVLSQNFQRVYLIHSVLKIVAGKGLT